MKDFGEAADFDLTKDKDDYCVSIKNIDHDVHTVIKDEFANYVLYLMKHV